MMSGMSPIYTLQVKSGADEGHTDQIEVCKGQKSQDKSELSKVNITIQTKLPP